LELERGNILGTGDEFFQDLSDMKWEMTLRFGFGMMYVVEINH
jgi:hypothetical protein